jgi:hypothetical protein
MAELLSHVLLAFAAFTALGWAVDWLDRGWVVVGMVGSLFPDLNRLELLISSHTIEGVLGIPFGWSGLHTLGGVVALAGAGALCFRSRRERLRAFGLLGAGGLSHLVVDGVKAWADGAGGAFLFPVSWWRAPTPGWYVSADRWVLVLAAAVAGTVLLVDRYRRGSADRGTGPDGRSSRNH